MFPNVLMKLARTPAVTPHPTSTTTSKICKEMGWVLMAVDLLLWRVIKPTRTKLSLLKLQISRETCSGHPQGKDLTVFRVVQVSLTQCLLPKVKIQAKFPKVCLVQVETLLASPTALKNPYGLYWTKDTSLQVASSLLPTQLREVF